MTRELNIVNDFNTLAVPMDMIAKKNGVSLHYVIRVIHYATIGKYKEIEEAKQCIS